MDLALTHALHQGTNEMKNLSVIYHSAHGHTEHIAEHVAEGSKSVPSTRVHVLKAEAIARVPDELLGYGGIILGSPT
jgi:flavorubredoxin